MYFSDCTSQTALRTLSYRNLATVSFRAQHCPTPLEAEEDLLLRRAHPRADRNQSPTHGAPTMLKESVNEVQLDDIINKFVFLTIILAAVLGAASAQTASTPSFRSQTVMTSGSPGSIRAGHILVRFKTTPAQGVLDQLNTAFGAKAVGKIAEIGVTHLQVQPHAALALLNHLHKRSDVEFAEFDSEVQAFLQPDDPYF